MSAAGVIHEESTMTRVLGDLLFRTLGGLGLGQGAGGAGLSYLLRDDFTTAVAAPLPSPRNCEPGPGVLTITDSANHLTVVSAELTADGGTVSTNDPWIRNTIGFARLAGRALFLRFKRTVGSGNSPIYGWANTLTAPDTSETYGLLQATARPEGVSIPTIITNGTYYKIVLAHRSTGQLIFVDNVLAWVGTSGSEATLYPHVSSRTTTDAWVIDYFRVRDLPSPFNADYGIATFTDTTLISGDTFTGNADGLHDFEFTLPGSPAANDEIALHYRRLDASNKWEAVVKRNVGNTAWDFLLRRVSAGVPTTEITVTGVGTPDMLRVISEGNNHDCYTRAGTTWTKRGAQVINSTHAAETGMAIAAVAGTTLTRVTAWPRSNADWNAQLNEA